ncbi:MAG TPA: alpha-1,2-fucosyltransferase [Candidatus Paceibacterota bacterium]|nr:alpha-1,2-fucosyltransferase [Candidatus Paceibacterota bacterium]
MITTFFRGGLGNQMFQYAAGLALAKRNGADFFCDITHINDRFPRRNFTYRTFDLPKVFSIEPRYTALSKLSQALPIPGVWLGIDLLFMNIREEFHQLEIIYEDKRLEFDPAVLAAKGNVMLYGRWENEKYFKDTEADVRQAFRFRNLLTGEASLVAKQIESSNSVSIHVRRGDYAAFKNVQQTMGETNINYYHDALRHMASRVQNPRFFVFSDDVEWCKKNLPQEFSYTFAEPTSAGPHAAFHLELMSRCKHNIIANSTFSWWGAWLNANPGKMVIAPKRWYADPALAGSDIVPVGWERL